jgi:hypothetical protein
MLAVHVAILSCNRVEEERNRRIAEDMENYPKKFTQAIECTIAA